VHQNRYSFNPTLTLTNKEDTTLTIQGRISRFEQQAYQGLPAVGTVAGSFRLNPDLYIGPSNIPKSFSEVKSVTATFDHRFEQSGPSTSKRAGRTRASIRKARQPKLPRPMSVRRHGAC
jgi:hypothetical protein